MTGRYNPDFLRYMSCKDGMVSATERGNITRSDLLNKLIRRVKKFEVRHQGAESKARRSVEFDEFMNLLLLARAQCGQGSGAYLRSNTAMRSAVGGESSRREFAALHSQIAAIQRDGMAELQRLRREYRDRQTALAILRRVAIQPFVRQVAATPNNVQKNTLENQRTSVVMLSKWSKDLFELWHEYQVSCKNFTTFERGSNKCVYSRRKTFWDVISNLVRAGFTSDAAIEKVYNGYGRQSDILV
ncbi:LOW QUALITY PROTEIN: hypothetical protein PHMEG_00020051 [Phytophthora megakarya]|uniref:Uncharacterized protein n=1 Tax=Phytophthora megakarya TaxID=4795 RepID=A0A225VQC2_9STRA|nr:LOW QUALITY PROTEIN: hypothetical protein PHMEG_00020051 [Phytophthora megakarya]